MKTQVASTNFKWRTAHESVTFLDFIEAFEFLVKQPSPMTQDFLVRNVL